VHRLRPCAKSCWASIQEEVPRQHVAISSHAGSVAGELSWVRGRESGAALENVDRDVPARYDPAAPGTNDLPFETVEGAQAGQLL